MPAEAKEIREQNEI